MPIRFADLAPFAALHGRRDTARAFQTAFTAVSFAGAALLTGCGVGRMLPNVSTATSAVVHGKVHGGQQPVSGAQIQLWAAGTASNASAATPLLTSAVYTDGGGGFDISGDYTCPSATTQVYITATGGDPGLGNATNNAALALVAPLGDCGSLATVPTISINELTTVAAAYGLAPFAAGVAQVGAPSTNLAGLRSAMQMSMMLASPYTGQAPSDTLPANATTETAKLVTLANVIGNCVNSSGGAECSTLAGDVSVTGLGTPADTFEIALMVAQHPGSNVQTVFNDAPAHAAFGGSLASEPHDWSMSVSYTGGGLGNPKSVSVDGAGVVWLANYYGGVSGFSAQGVPVFANGVTSGMGLSSAATVDSTGYLWVANGAYDFSHNVGSVARVAADGSVLSGDLGFTSGGINLPSAIAALPNGTVAVLSSGSSILTMLDNDGTVLSGFSGYGNGLLSDPSAIAVDGSSNLWITNKANGTLVQMDPLGNVLLQGNLGGSPDSIAIDSNGTLWVGDSSASTLAEVRSDGVVGALLTSAQPSSFKALTIDGGGHLFIADAFNGYLLEVHDSSFAAPGYPVVTAPLFGLDVQLQAPSGMAVDASGNLWVASSGDNRLVGFIGTATPVSTPHVGLPVQP